MKILSAKLLLETEDCNGSFTICMPCIGAIARPDPQMHDDCKNSFDSACYCDCWKHQSGLESGRFVQTDE